MPVDTQLMKMPLQSLGIMQMHPGRLTILPRSFVSPGAQLRLPIYHGSKSEVDWYEIRKIMNAPRKKI